MLTKVRRLKTRNIINNCGKHYSSKLKKLTTKTLQDLNTFFFYIEKSDFIIGNEDLTI